MARDAAEAGVRAPALDELSRKLPYRVDDARHVLEIGQPSREIARVRLRAIHVHVQDGLALEVANATGSDIAYEVVTAPVHSTR